MKPHDENDDKVVRDGQSVSLSVTLMDSTQKSVASDAIAVKQRISDAHERYRADLCIRWRSPPAATQTPSPLPPLTRDAATAYAAYDSAIANRWRKAC